MIQSISDIEQRIIAKLKQGNEAVFEQVYKLLYHELFSFCKGYLIATENAKEVTQEVFLALWETRLRLAGDTHLRAYLFTIARNKCLNFIRTNSLRIRVVGEASREKELELNIQSLTDDSFDEIFLDDLVEALNKAIEELPDGCKDYFIMNKIRGLTYAQIAKIKNVSVKNVEYHMSNALTILRKKLGALTWILAFLY